MSIRVGTSGWSYPGGRGTWNGVFYPPAGLRPRGFNELSYYAEHFNTVEVNSTFYGQPRAEVSVLRRLGEHAPDLAALARRGWAHEQALHLPARGPPQQQPRRAHARLVHHDHVARAQGDVPC